MAKGRKLMAYEDIERRFWEKVDAESGDNCREYRGYKLSAGYGMFYDGDKTAGAHRFAWELINGPIPAGMSVLHKCDNPSCCNPNHLYLGTQSDNISDRAKRNSTNQGGQTKFYEGEIWLIRKLKIIIGKTSIGKPKYKFSTRYVAKMFKVHQTTILNIWKSNKYLCKEGYYV